MNYSNLPPYPLIKIDTDKITANAKKIIRLCARRNISAYPVLKSMCGFKPAAVAAIEAGPEGVFDSGARQLADMASIAGAAGIKRGLIKLMSESELESSLDYLSEIDFFFVSDISHLKALAKFKPGALAVLMIDSGDLREGIPQHDLNKFLSGALKIKKVSIYGAATNHACFSGIVPTAPIMDKFIESLEAAEIKHRIEFKMISGGNSSLLSLIEENKTNGRVNNIRVGEAVFLGSDVLTRKPISWLEQNVFTVAAEIVECREKESILEGVRTQNAFNEVIDFARRNVRPGAKTRRAILNLGKKHFYVNGIKPLEAGVYVVGASSDYLIADISECGRRLKCGDTLEFALDYAALMSAMRGAGKYISYSLA
jgi:predicted amino acid racemase